MRFRLTLIHLVLVLLLAFPAAAGASVDPSTDGDGPVVVLPVEQAKPTTGERVVEVARRYLGLPYVWAGSTPAGFDCSGLVMYAYGRAGIVLPHNGAMLWGLGRPVARDELEPGDVVFFDALGHVGIYVGHGRFIHSPHTGDVVKISSLSEGWYRSSYVGARRYG